MEPDSLIPDVPFEMDMQWDSGCRNDIQIHIESATPPRLFFDDEMRQPQCSPDCVRIHQESMTPQRLLFDDEISCLGKRKAGPEKEMAGPGSAVDEDEEWEAELDECLAPNLTEIRDWKTLHEQIKKDLARKYKLLPLSQVNQLMILHNFAMLCLRGLGRIEASKEIARQFHQKLEGSSGHFAHRIWSLAHHYQIFEQLPREC